MGFFTRQEAKAGGAGRKGRAAAPFQLSPQAARALAPDIRKRINPRALSPEMAPSGARRPWLYILGEAPDQDEDEQGQPLVGVGGQLLLSYLPEQVQKKARANNVITTRLPSKRSPTATEIEAFRSGLEDDIAQSKPRVILGLGMAPLAWIMAQTGLSATISTMRGRKILVSIKGHTCWFVPVLNPAFVLQLDQPRSYFQDVPGKEWIASWKHDVKMAAALALDSTPPPPALTQEKVQKGVQLLRDYGEAILLLRSWIRRRPDACYGLDIETQGLRPQATGARILSIAISGPRGTIAVPILHPDHLRDRLPDHDGFFKFLREEFFPGRRIVAQNATFEIEWLGQDDGIGFPCLLSVKWEDTMHLAYTLDARKGALSLNFLCWAKLGLPLKQISKVDVGNLAEASLDSVLHYNALDANGTRLLFLRMRKELPASLKATYRAQVASAFSAATMQAAGVPIDRKVVVKFKAEFTARRDQQLRRIIKSAPAQTFGMTTGQGFNPSSNSDLVVLFRDILQRREGFRQKRGAEKTYSTDEEVLDEVIKRGGRGADIAASILELRGLEKNLGTYIEPLLSTAGARPIVWPDGKIHCDIRTAATDTGRTATDGPSMQNWPKRKNREIRAIVAPPDGWVVLSSDLGQIEARGLCMASQDKSFTRALFEGYDIHLAWAERLAQLDPGAFKEKAGKDMKKFRDAIKNEMVFPAFYGAQPESIAGYLGTSPEIAHVVFEEFWEEFAGVKAWQNESAAFYRRNGYVETLTGRRRYGPLSQNMVLNSPIQGLAADILREAWRRIVCEAVRRHRPWLIPRLNIHDDLVFMLPKKRVDEALEVIVPAMIKHPQWDWITVPLTTEVSIGPNWAALTKQGNYDSRRV